MPQTRRDTQMERTSHVRARGRKEACTAGLAQASSGRQPRPAPLVPTFSLNAEFPRAAPEGPLTGQCASVQPPVAPPRHCRQPPRRQAREQRQQLRGLEARWARLRQRGKALLAAELLAGASKETSARRPWNGAPWDCSQGP